MALGGGTLVLFPLVWLLRSRVGLDASETFIDAFAYHAALVINNPHFAVTYLLFYKDARKRVLRGELAGSIEVVFNFFPLVVRRDYAAQLGVPTVDFLRSGRVGMQLRVTQLALQLIVLGQQGVNRLEQFSGPCLTRSGSASTSVPA